MHGKLLQLSPTLWSPMDCSPPGSSVHGILQARILEWVAIFPTQGSNPGLLHCRQILYGWATWGVHRSLYKYSLSYLQWQCLPLSWISSVSVFYPPALHWPHREQFTGTGAETQFCISLMVLIHTFQVIIYHESRISLGAFIIWVVSIIIIPWTVYYIILSSLYTARQNQDLEI